MTAKDRIIVALDVDHPDKATELVTKLAPVVGCFKIGLEFITTMIVLIIAAADEQLAVVIMCKIRELFRLLRGKVFWDGKFDDIPTTVGAAAKALGPLNLKMFNVHATSSIDSMFAAADNRGLAQAFAVTILTSFEENDAFLEFGAPSKTSVLRCARDAKLAGLDGIICSPQELTLVGKRRELLGLKKVTPGIRSPEDPPDDQKRTLTPAEAVRAGADMLVIGRPITKAACGPVEATERIAEQIYIGLKERFHASLFDLGKIKFGAFKLKLHEKNPEAPLSPIYLNIRDLPDWAYTLTGDLLHELVVRENIGDFDYVIGIPKAGEPIGRAFAKAVGKPLLRIEKIEAEGGRKISSNILDPFERGKKAVLVDDLVTKAHTKREAIESVEANGLEVVATVVLYDRQQGGLEELNRTGRKVATVSRLGETLDFFVREKKIPAEKKDEVMAYIAAN
jgi:orotidine-5'-phosphate decarboxylase